MRLLIALSAAASAAILFLIMTNSYSIYAQSLSRTWGSFGTGDGQFDRPAGITNQDLGRSTMYVVDSGNDRIQMFTPDGKFISKWGSTGSGDGQFNFPVGLTVDQKGNVLVADTGNNRIQKFTGDGKFVTKWTNLGLTSGGNIQDQVYIEIDALDNLYITNRGNNQVQVISTAG
jgi:tripartite motif-containing protein 71